MFSVIALVTWAIIGLPILNQLWRDSPQHEAEQNGPPAFFPLKLFTSAGRDEIARYCASKSEDWAHKYVCDVKITNAYLNVFNFLLVLVTAGLIYAGFRTIGKMRDTEERQLRAYVFASAGALTKGGNNVWQLQITFKNSGQTPAYQFNQFANSDVIDLPVNERDFVVLRAGSISRGVLPPGQMAVTTLTHHLSPAEVTAVGAGTAQFYVFGEIQFVDAFKYTRTVRFRFMHMNTSRPTDLVFAEEGNEEVTRSRSRWWRAAFSRRDE